MPKFIDIHQMEGVTEQEVAEAHAMDLEVQEKHGANFVKYWVNEETGKVFCLSEAPSKQAALAVHEEAGHPPDEIYEVVEGA